MSSKRQPTNFSLLNFFVFKIDQNGLENIRKIPLSYVTNSALKNMSKALPYFIPNSMDSNQKVSKCMVCGTKLN